MQINYKTFKKALLAFIGFTFFNYFLAEVHAQNIGVGIAAPTMKLHVANQDSDLLLLENTLPLNSNVSTALYLKSGNGFTGSIKTIGQNLFEARLGFFTYASLSPEGLIERISILDNGNVGINTIDPSTILEVNGDVKINGKISNVSDPVSAQDVATKAYVDVLEAYIAALELQITDLAGIKDIDNNHYDIVTIGTQVWMSDNLRVTRYNDGTPIPVVPDAGQWQALFSPAYTWYNNGLSGYGALYNYFVVADTNGLNVCPVGWHVPSNAEWITLTDYLGGESVAGAKLKESGLQNWKYTTNSMTNETGFSALPGGKRYTDGGFDGYTVNGYYWTSTEYDNTDARARSFYAYNIPIFPYWFNKQHGLSVRCLKD